MGAATFLLVGLLLSAALRYGAFAWQRSDFNDLEFFAVATIWITGAGFVMFIGVAPAQEWSSSAWLLASACAAAYLLYRNYRSRTCAARWQVTSDISGGWAKRQTRATGHRR